MNRYARIELHNAIASVVLAVLEGLWIIITTCVENETFSSLIALLQSIKDTANAGSPSR